MRHAFNLGIPESPELPEIAKKDATELKIRALAKKALPSMPQIDFMGEGPTPAQELQAIQNYALQKSYRDDRFRLARDRAVSRIEERKLSNALAKRDAIAGKNLRKRGAAKYKYGQQRIKNIAGATGLGPELYRVLRT